MRASVQGFVQSAMGSGVSVTPADPVQAQRFAVSVLTNGNPSPSAPSQTAAACAPPPPPGPFKPVAIAFVVAFGVLLIVVLNVAVCLSFKAAAAKVQPAPEMGGKVANP